MAIANTDTFALAVVQSSDPKLQLKKKSLFTLKQETKQKNTIKNILIKESTLKKFNRTNVLKPVKALQWRPPFQGFYHLNQSIRMYKLLLFHIIRPSYYTSYAG